MDILIIYIYLYTLITVFACDTLKITFLKKRQKAIMKCTKIFRILYHTILLYYVCVSVYICVCVPGMRFTARSASS